ncbi:hypothetical protein HPB48_001277 [Haemaphysalis longicornis]|uniref:Uncharacterized protein n=1 Tax=Haemaphysalis longicornis TaxID=44386 RepID=A0A9J6FHV1_HAELO|nr:hypothetical protein HPB48_001277 [Haemaphysalis longicornis]
METTSRSSRDCTCLQQPPELRRKSLIPSAHQPPPPPPPPQNAAVISTPHAETADILRKLTHIKLAGKEHAMFACVAAHDNSVKGVVHGTDPGTKPSET